jgi:hypothetical protein
LSYAAGKEDHPLQFSPPTLVLQFPPPRYPFPVERGHLVANLYIKDSLT